MGHSVADIFFGKGHQPGKKARISLHSEKDWAQSRYSNVMAGVEKIQSGFKWSANRKLSRNWLLRRSAVISAKPTSGPAPLRWNPQPSHHSLINT